MYVMLPSAPAVWLPITITFGASWKAIVFGESAFKRFIFVGVCEYYRYIANRLQGGRVNNCPFDGAGGGGALREGKGAEQEAQGQ